MQWKHWEGLAHTVFVSEVNYCILFFGRSNSSLCAFVEYKKINLWWPRCQVWKRDSWLGTIFTLFLLVWFLFQNLHSIATRAKYHIFHGWIIWLIDYELIINYSGLPTQSGRNFPAALLPYLTLPASYWGPLKLLLIVYCVATLSKSAINLVHLKRWKRFVGANIYLLPLSSLLSYFCFCPRQLFFFFCFLLFLP